MANGILVIDKSAGWTSQDVAAKLRGVFHERRVGHGGTLDPMATGVLPVFIGRATRAAEFLESAEKEYVAGLRLGVVTDTQDTSGTVLETNSVCVTRAQLEAALRQFLGPIEQIPPMYSAIKINGQKLYELARRGQEVARRPRSITIHALELLEGEGADWTVRVRCSKGTYVRTLCHDLGRALGCGGCMSSLRRTRAGSFTLAQAVTMQQVLDFAAGQDPQQLLMPVDAVFAAHPPLIVTLGQAAKLKNGAQVKDWQFQPGTYRVYAEDGEFLLLGRVEGGVLTTIKSFFEVNTLGT
ncbi:MAG: tRNA pseudouridine(55) synthase TruB [Oscillospiraceae bacterium]|nr:tRNA pseudouridine(55) synthase TruB [Clostridiales bacterium]MDY2718544.1 tRNA pseudouridine(55) synthase TruB [Oscillospiraceae bacterium]MDY4994640.1 tRNA pseudouridine(55) synthase TruB [Oscillospiraceae bacterium]